MFRQSNRATFAASANGDYSLPGGLAFWSSRGLSLPLQPDPGRYLGSPYSLSRPFDPVHYPNVSLPRRSSLIFPNKTYLSREAASLVSSPPCPSIIYKLKWAFDLGFSPLFTGNWKKMGEKINRDRGELLFGEEYSSLSRYCTRIISAAETSFVQLPLSYYCFCCRDLTAAGGGLFWTGRRIYRIPRTSIFAVFLQIKFVLKRVQYVYFPCSARCSVLPSTVPLKNFKGTLSHIIVFVKSTRYPAVDESPPCPPRACSLVLSPFLSSVFLQINVRSGCAI